MKIIKIIGKIIGALMSLLIIVVVAFYISKVVKSKNNFKKLGQEALTLTINGKSYRDLNKNGKLDIYENYNKSVDERVNDLVSQMTLEEKAGSMFFSMIGMTSDGETQEKPDFSGDEMNTMMSFMFPSGSEMLVNKRINSFNIHAAFDPIILARFNNRLQNMAERTRLGVPITIASDPRHSRSAAMGISIDVSSFSTWPTQLGMAASRDTVLVREFGDIARKEYLSVGIRLSLNPMADLATEPRWTRMTGTYGEDADLAATMTKAYILGFQGDSLNANSVACMTKHFSGGGPQEDGMDAHFASGKNQIYPGNNFDYHLIPFLKGAFPANSAQIMPYYGVPVDQTEENVGFAFNKSIITTLLRDSLNYNGVVCTDWALITDKKFKEASAWGAEHLTPIERVEKIINAGCDMFGGESIPELVIELVNSGKISEERIDISVKRIMRDKFRLGLFEDPYVDEGKANKIAGRADFRLKGKEAQTKSLVLLKNDNILPLKKGTKIFIAEDMDKESWGKFGELVSNKEDADVVIKKINTPFSPPVGGMMEGMFHQGRLYYDKTELSEIISSIDKKPSIILANLERATILTEVNEKTDALLVQFGGVEDDVLAGMVFGETSPSGKLPIELPSSWEAVLKQKEDVPFDSEEPLYPYGFGLSYE